MGIPLHALVGDLDSIFTILLYHLPPPLIPIFNHLDHASLPILITAACILLTSFREWKVPLKLGLALWGPLFIKWVVQRHRPFHDMGWAPRRPAKAFKGPDVYSFPSGHSAAITVLFLEAWKAWGVRGPPPAFEGSNFPVWPCSVLWLLMTVARTVLGVHWLGDVVGGWLLGFLISFSF